MIGGLLAVLSANLISSSDESDNSTPLDFALLARTIVALMFDQ